MKRKILIMSLIICLVLSSAAIVFADSTWQTITALFNGMTVKVNGQFVQADNILYNGTTYLPLRAVSQALGANVNYIDETKTAEITLNASNQNIDRFAVDIAQVYVDFEQIGDLINSRQSVANNIITSYLSGYYSNNDISNEISEYEKKNLPESNDYISNHLSMLAEYLSGYPGDKSMTEDFLKIKSYLKDIEAMEVNRIELLKNVLKYGLDNNSMDRFENLRNAISDSCFALRSIAISNYYNITDNIVNGKKYAPASKSLNYKTSYFITVPTNISANSTTTTTTTTPMTIPSGSFPLHLYSNDGKTYLGKLVTNKFDSNSIFNEFGDYGSEFSSKSIWNEFGDYGSEYSDKSAFNKYASKPPKIVDNKGNFVGYLTANEYMTDGYSLAMIIQFLKENYQ